GNEFVSAVLRVENDKLTEWWRVMVFERGMQTELLSLQTGDILSAQGRFQNSHYLDKDGEKRLSPTPFASAISPIRPPAKKTARADKQAKTAEPAPFNDAVPF